MAYTPVDWKNSSQTPVNSTNLNIMDTGIKNLDTITTNHINSNTAHNSQNISYSGNVSGANNIKAAADKLNDRIDNIVSYSGSSNQEIVDARNSAVKSTVFSNLDARLEASETDFDTLKAKVENTSYSSITEITASIFSLPSTVIKGQLSASIFGNTITNLLGTDGDCEQQGRWAVNYTTDTSLKLYGNSSFRRTVTATGGVVFGDFNNIVDPSKYYIVIFGLYIRSYTSGGSSLAVFDAGGYLNSSSTSFNSALLNQWQFRVVKFTGKSGIRLEAGFTNPSTCDINIDGGRLYEVTQSEYNSITNGDASSLLTKYPYVSGTKSTLSARVKSIGKNLIKNGNCENDIAYWTLGALNGSTGVYTSSVGTLTVSNGEFLISGNAQYSGMTSDYIQIQANKNYVLSANGYTPDTGKAILYIVAYDVNKNFVGTLSYSNSNTTSTPMQLSKAFTTQTNAAYIRFYAGTYNATGSTKFNSIMLSEGTTVPSTYESYTESSLYLPNNITLNSVGSVKDEVNAPTGEYIKRVSDKVLLDGSLDWKNDGGGSFVGYKFVYLLAFPNIAYNSRNSVIKYNGVQLNYDVNKSIDSSYVGATGATGITVPNADSGFTDAITPTVNEWKAYFYGWKMCASDGSSYVSGTKYWKKITDGTGITSTLPTASYSGYTPYSLYYQLVTPINMSIQGMGEMIAEASGTVMIEPVVQEIQKPTTGVITIKNTSLPIVSVESVKRIDILPDGTSQYVDVTYTNTSTTITPTSADNTKEYKYSYYYDSSLSTLPTIQYSYSNNLKAVVDGLVNMVSNLSKIVRDLILTTNN